MALTANASILFKINSDEVVYKSPNGDVVLKAPKEEKKDINDGWWSPQNAMTICASVLVFGLAVIVITAHLGSKPHGEDFNKFNLVVLVIIASLFVVVAGYTEQQITPVIGLLGTIVGYVLGKDKK